MESKNYEEIISNILKESRGFIDIAVISTEDGLPIASRIHSETDPGFICAVTTAISGAVISVLDVLKSNKFDRVDITLDDGRHFLIVPYKNMFFSCVTTPNPNLGLIYLILRKHLV
ncbi:MAG TPA: hypothetical protein ENG40_04715 [Thermoprotei archaeon]|nr:hypothetical protein [Thermoprotei archaeon]